jgi:hypothetical protein
MLGDGDGDGFAKLTALPLASVILMALDFFTGRTKLLEADADPACAWLTGVCEGATGLCAGVPGWPMLDDGRSETCDPERCIGVPGGLYGC